MEAFIFIAGILFLAIASSGGNKNPSKFMVAKTKIIDSSHTATSSSQTKMGSVLARGAVGGLLLGPVGMVAGAATAKKKTTVVEHHTTTFMVYYKNGTRKAETVENGSDLYNLYISKLDLGE